MSQVYGFIQRAHGAVNVYSEVNVGTKFNLYFPRGIDKNDQMSIDRQHQATVSSGHEKILVVDDEPALRLLTSEILRGQGYEVYVADNGQSALTFLEDNEIDLIVSDIIMPVLDGYELAEQVKRLHPQVKLQLVSGFNEKESDLDNQRDILLKPFATKDLVQKVRDLLDS